MSLRTSRTALYSVAAAGILAAVAIGWTVLQDRSSVADPVFSRDRLVSAPVLTAISTDNGSGSFRLVMFEDGRYLLTRADGHSETVVAFTGRRAIYQAAESCFATASDIVALALIPGVTAVPVLDKVAGRTETGTTVSYSFDTANGVTRHAEEQLADAGPGGSYRVSVAYDASLTNAEEFLVREATGAEVDEALAVFQHEPSRLGSVVLQPRLLDAGQAGAAQYEIQALVIADCPEVPAYPPISRPPAPAGTLPATMPFQIRVEGGKFFAEDVWLVEEGIGADAASIQAETATTAPGTFRLEGGATYAVRSQGSGVTLYRVVACGPPQIITCPPAD